LRDPKTSRAAAFRTTVVFPTDEWEGKLALHRLSPNVQHHAVTVIVSLVLTVRLIDGLQTDAAYIAWTCEAAGFISCDASASTELNRDDNRDAQ